MSNYLIVPYGLPGTGKSDYSKKLQEEFNCGYYSLTQTRRELGHKRYSTKKTPVVMSNTITKTANSLLKSDIILESSFVKKATRERIYDIFGDWSNIIMIEFTCARKLAIKRMQQKKKNDGLVTEARNPKTYDKILEKYEPVEEEERNTHNDVEYCQFNSDTGEFTILNNGKKDKTSGEMIEKIRATLVDTFTEITSSQHKNNTTD